MESLIATATVLCYREQADALVDRLSNRLEDHCAGVERTSVVRGNEFRGGGLGRRLWEGLLR